MGSANDCQPYAELLSDLADGELEGVEATRVEGHVAQCAACKAELALLSGVVRNLIAIGEEQVPAELARRVMAEVKKPSLLERILGGLSVLTEPSFWKIAAPVTALVLMAVVLRPHLGDDHASAKEKIAGVPVWWGGNLLVNELPHPANRSGRLGLKSGDGVRTGEKVEATLPIHGAQIEVRPRTNLIVTPTGLSVTDGQIVVHVEESRAPREAPFRVTTPNTVIEHIGTVFKVTVSPKDGTRTDVYSGRVRISSGGQIQEAGAGDYVTVGGSGQIETGPSFAAPMLKPPRATSEEVRSISQGLPGGPTR
jgi:hypothetical protein